MAEINRKKSKRYKCRSRSELNHVREGLCRDEDVSSHRVNGVGLLGSKNVGDVRVVMRMRRNLGHSGRSGRSGSLHRGDWHLGRHRSLSFNLGLSHGRHGERPGVAAFAATFRRIFHL